MINIEWTEGAPGPLEIGMVVRVENGQPLLVGSFCDIDEDEFLITHWAWLIKPYQLSWIDSKTGVPKR
jgi:hypothetical protein